MRHKGVKVNFSYSTLISFSERVQDHSFALRATPRVPIGGRVVSHEIRMVPGTPLSTGTDSFGNTLTTGHLDLRHDFLAYESAGCVETQGALCHWADLRETSLYAFATQLTTPSDPMMEMALKLRGSADRGEPMSDNDLILWSQSLMDVVSERMTYTPGVTTIETTAAQAWQMQCGVCQDFAQVAIALARAAGIPARYVCGLLMGEGATHAWVELKASADMWLAIDPTHHRLVTEEYIKMAHGRDFTDCSMSRGAFRGGNARQDTRVTCLVTPVV